MKKKDFLALKTIENTNKIVVLIGASGSGKTSLATELANTLKIPKITTSTTRTPRSKEEYESNAYNFYTKDYFAKLESKGLFLEITEYSTNQYGILFSDIEEYNNSVCCVITDVSGARRIADTYPDRAMVFWLKSEPLLSWKRLRKRGETFRIAFKRIVNAIKNSEFKSPTNLFIDVSFTELHSDTDIMNNLGIIYYKLLASEHGAYINYLLRLESENNVNNGGI